MTADGAIGLYRRVKAQGRTARLAGANDYGVGVAQEGVANGDDVAVRLDIHGGSLKMVASGAITAGARVYAAASGKISASGTQSIGTALDAASGDGSVIAVLPSPGGVVQSSSSSSSSSST
jgi:hypothetical protein